MSLIWPLPKISVGVLIEAMRPAGVGTLTTLWPSPPAFNWREGGVIVTGFKFLGTGVDALAFPVGSVRIFVFEADC